MAATFPSSTNVFVPAHDAANGLVVNFSRNQDEFAVNRYAQLVPQDKVTGFWLEMTVEQAGRIVNSDGRDTLWPDRQMMPFGELESHEYQKYTTLRRAFPFTLGSRTVEQASWNIEESHVRINGQRAMTVRTQIVATLVQTPGNWDSTHTNAVTGLTGPAGTVAGKWDVATTANQSIRRSIYNAAEIVRTDTLGAVRNQDLILVISPATAAAIAQSQEIVDYIKGSPDAMAQIRGDAPNPNQSYGLPARLYGIDLVVEDAVKTTSRKGATTVKVDVWDKTRPALVSRVGGLVGDGTGPSFSTVTLFMHEEMTVAAETDQFNRLVKGAVVEDYGAELTANVSGFLFQDAVAA